MIQQNEELHIMDRLSLKDLHAFYVDHLMHTLVPFWLNYGLDRENGGYFTCFNNAGDRLVSKHKYTWSQGRFLWMVSRLTYAFGDYVEPDRHREFLEAAHLGAEFLRDHALLPNGHAVWAMDEAGNPILVDFKGNILEAQPDDEYDLGIAADVFLVYGMGEYARASGRREYFDFALKLFDSVEERLESGNYKAAPDHIPKGYDSHDKSMIVLETAQELASVARFFNDSSAVRLMKSARKAMRRTLDVFLKSEDQLLLERVKTGGETAYDELLGSSVLPGHALEDAWFIMHFAMTTGDDEALRAGMDITRWMTELGWDQEYGGIPQYVHKDGGPPRGRILDENRDDRMIVLLRENWANKLWWVHSEALYALILSFEHSSDPWFMETYGKLHEYVFSTFPNPDRKVGEWIQIRDREGRPEDKVVALPVKDPYHITRAFMHLIKSLERMIETGRTC